MGKTGSCSGGQAFLSIALIQLFVDAWGYTPFVVVVWPGVTQPWCPRALW